MDTAQLVLQSARSFFTGSALSRITGFLRDVSMAACFGSSSEIAAFMVAYRLANLFRRVIGEGNLQAGFIPHFVSMKEGGSQFFRDTSYSLALLSAFFVGWLELFLWGLQGFVSADWQEILKLSMWMLPSLFFLSLYALNASLLQCRKKYFLPSMAPVFFNLVWIAAVFLKKDVRFLSMMVTVGFMAQWMVTLKEGFSLLSLKEWLKPRLFSKEFQKLLSPLLLGVVGVSAVQFNSALDAIFARIADVKGPAFLWYAIRIQQLPLAFLGVAFASALLPSLSREEDPVKREALLMGILKKGSFFMLLASFGIALFGYEGILFLYQHGGFSKEDALKTAQCLWGYAPGLLPSMCILILASRFYAEKEYKLPMRASLIAVVVNIALNSLFIFLLGLGAISIALATSISAFVNAFLLFRGVLKSSFLRELLEMFWICFLSAGLVFLGKRWIVFEDLSTPFKGLYLAVGGVIFTSCCWGVQRKRSRRAEDLLK